MLKGAEAVYEGYYLTGNPPGVQTLRRVDGKEAFLLLDRAFSEIDSYLGHTVSRFIKHYISTNHSISVLDIGGGAKSRAAQDIANLYPGFVSITNVDLVAEESQLGPNARAHRMDALALQLADRSFDLVYSYQFLPFLDPTGIFSRATQAISEAARVLKPGGAAILHETFYTLMVAENEKLNVLSLLLQNMDTKILLRHPWPLLILGRKPINPDLALIAQEQYVKLDMFPNN